MNCRSLPQRRQGLLHASCGSRCRPARQRTVQLICMAQPRRVARVASAIQREIGDLLAHDPALQEAVSPNRSETDAVTAVAGVTDVYVTNDLSHAKVYLSIYSNPEGRRAAFRRLKKLEPYVRHHIGQRVPLRLVPEVRLVYDDTLEEQELVAKVLADEQKRLYGVSPADAYQDDAEEEQEEEEEDGFFDDNQDMSNATHYSSDDVFREPGPFDSMFSDNSYMHKKQQRQGSRGK